MRAALFENVVERHSVLVLDEDPARGQDLPRRSLSLRRREEENEGNLVTATYREPVSPSSPLRVEHSYDTVPAVGESRAVSESVPSAQLEDKATTLRRRSDRAAGAQPAEDQPPRYLRVGGLQKWNPADPERQTERGGKPEEEREMQRGAERQMQMDVGRETRREKEREEVAAPKRLKMLEANEQPAKPRATYFALTGQAQEVVSPGEESRAERGDSEVPFDDYSVKAGQWGSQGKVLPLRRTTPLDDALGRSLQSRAQDEERAERSPTQDRQRGMPWVRPGGMEDMEIEKQKQMDSEKQRALDREAQRQVEMERQVEFARKTERERSEERRVGKECRSRWSPYH